MSDNTATALPFGVTAEVNSKSAVRGYEIFLNLYLLTNSGDILHLAGYNPLTPLRFS